MNNLKNIKNFDDLKELVLSNKELIKKAALPLTVVAALLFFWITGGDSKGELSVKESEEQSAKQEEVKVGDDFDSEEAGEAADIYVDISGCVKNPGVYKVEPGTRIFQVIERAGGLTDGADTESVNRAEEVADGQKIVIRHMEASSEEESIINSDKSSGKVNINTADMSELQSVPGIGPATAQKIIEYREHNGKFKSVEDILNVSGIGDKTLENMRPYITV
ncbi:MAG: helix-hairpin-helix domain-containing protein [Anaerovoracaceae bacterium]|nr:helix-hairpin-helix domain-containing protein [Bacillota bacterium]MEE0517137.1 helix-hairpin-helix domain-containing protein [Anaerovoracaceae bacterium]